MSRTYRASERKNITGRKKWAKLPPEARGINKYQKIHKLEIAAMKKGERLDSKYYAMCYNKVRYTKDSADRKTQTHLAGLVVPYKCDYCVHYHIGRPKDSPTSYKNRELEDAQRT